MRKFCFGLLVLCLSILLKSDNVLGQQIVSDPQLNQALNGFQERFSEFIQSRPELLRGAVPPVQLSATVKKIRFDFNQQGEYAISYGKLQLSSTNPISANRFVLTLSITRISLNGDATLVIVDKKGRSFNLQCPGNQFIVNAGSFSTQVEINNTDRPGSVLLNNRLVNIDTKSITVNLPCLQKKRLSDELGVELAATESQTLMLDGATISDGTILLDQSSLDGIESQVSDLFAETLPQILTQGAAPSQGTLDKVNSGIQSSATQPNSAVTMTAGSTAMTTGTSVATAASSPCSGTVYNDVKAVVADLSNIAAQANANGFKTAMQQFINDLKAILPTLSPPSQTTVQQLINDLNAAVADGKISTPEQLTLVNDFYNLVLSTGLTSSQFETIKNDLIAVANTLTGISTAQLQTDLQKLSTDAKSCLGL
ncbi:MAG: hypothetical protein AB1489_09385 [Acidobacteriota bacterium]